jgi:putative oxidoreductase
MHRHSGAATVFVVSTIPYWHSAELGFSHVGPARFLLSLGRPNFAGDFRTKIVVRSLMGLMFLVFGLNGFQQFRNSPIAGRLVGQFLQAPFQSHHFVLAIGAVQAVGGALLLINRYVPLALTILGPLIVNILLYHLLLNHEGIGDALIVAVFWFVLSFHYRQYSSEIFTAKASPLSCQRMLAGLRGRQALINEP